ncbi:MULTISPECIES: hypothetical protein [Sphingobacterium]|uniref:hypothetical protein n=1 Tax=Sphingobacterium TaxID=28453 RepID=UPI002FD9C8BA
MATIITYDIPSKHREFKQKMFELGYKQVFKDAKGKDVNLPNTTLLHQTKSSENALNDATQTCFALNISLERCITCQFGPDWSGIYGVPLN